MMPSRSSSSMMEPSASPLLQRHHHHHQQELQGPRPAPLRVSTTGMEMVVKRRRLHHHQRQPVIIYVESPRVVHAHPAEFKSVVQRLTGAPSAAPAPSPLMKTMAFSASSAPPPLQFPFQFQFPLVGAAGSAGDMLPLTSSIMSSSVTVADASGSSAFGQENLNLTSDSSFLLPLPSSSSSLAAFYHQQHHGGDIFIGHHQ